MQKAKKISPAPDILIIDDTPSCLQFLAALFTTQGFRTRAAMTGELALMAIQARHPDLILMDVHMPDISGIDLCKRIKTDPELKDIPVIFVSGEDEPLGKIKAFAAGGVDYITRPFQIDELISRVTTHLHLKKQQEQLQNTMLRMKELEELRDNLVHMIIHDLRNPLFVIDSYLTLIISDEARPLMPETAQYIRDAQTQTNIMIDLINSILDVSNMEEGPIQLHQEPCDLGVLCQQVSGEMAPLKQSRSLIFEAPDTPVIVTLDKELIRRVIASLIANAIRATSESDGDISIHMEVRQDFVRINICDNGRPVTAVEQTTIFEKNGQIHSALSGSGRYAPGLGMPFCKLAVTAHGGQVGVQSQPDTGNTFWIELPLAAHMAPAQS